jgi:uncharacterized UBP type Zn finger protein
MAQLNQRDKAMARVCTHLSSIRPQEPPILACQDCLATGRRDWVHLRMCMTCGHVGCCDNSPGRHATKHFSTTGHPIIRSLEPGENWFWCYVDEIFAVP